MNTRLTKFIMLGSFIFMVAVNALANIIPFNGVTTGEISDRYPTLITPAAYVFSIWGLIYILLAAFLVYLLLPKQQESVYTEKIGLLFVFSSLLNGVWMFAWHYDQLFLSMLIMLALLITLIAIYVRIHSVELSRRSFFFIRLPFSIYLGWISIATIANISVVLVANQWGRWGFAPEIWAVLILLTGMVLAMLALYKKDNFYPLVFIWAYIGIGLNSHGFSVTLVAFAIALVLAAYLIKNRANMLPVS